MMSITFQTLRKAKELTVIDIANAIGKKKGTVEKYECSSRVPGINTLPKLQKALSCSEEELMEAYSFHKQNQVKKKLKKKSK